MGEFQQAGERLIQTSRVFSMWEVSFVGPDGATYTRDVIRHLGAVSVVPLHDDGTVELVRQYRAPVDRTMLELPAGLLDVEGEALEVCAARELEEEVGLAAARFEHLTSFVNSPGFCDEVCHVYLATGLRDVGVSRQGIEEVHMTVERIALDGAMGLIEDGTITDAKTIIGLTLTSARRAETT